MEGIGEHTDLPTLLHRRGRVSINLDMYGEPGVNEAFGTLFTRVIPMQGHLDLAKRAVTFDAISPEFDLVKPGDPAPIYSIVMSVKYEAGIRNFRMTFDKYVPPAPPPVDRAARVLTDGRRVPDDNSHTRLKPNGQQEGYVVLSEEERAKGWVRPLRYSYVHKACGVPTTMNRALAETYARDPHFYSGTFCTGCGEHFPLDQFTWEGTDEQVGS